MINRILHSCKILYILLVTGLYIKNVFLSLNIVFVLINSEYADEMPHDTVLYYRIYCLPKYTLGVTSIHK